MCGYHANSTEKKSKTTNNNKLLAKVIIFTIYILNFVLACSCIKVQPLTWPKQPQTCPVLRDFCKTILFKTQGIFGPFLNENRLAKKSGHDAMHVEGHIKMKGSKTRIVSKLHKFCYDFCTHNQN